MDRHSEAYSWQNVNASVHNIIVGKLWIEHVRFYLHLQVLHSLLYSICLLINTFCVLMSLVLMRIKSLSQQLPKIHTEGTKPNLE